MAQARVPKLAEVARGAGGDGEGDGAGGRAGGGRGAVDGPDGAVGLGVLSDDGARIESRARGRRGGGAVQAEDVARVLPGCGGVAAGREPQRTVEAGAGTAGVKI